MKKNRTEEEEKKPNPIFRVLKTEWEYLGDRKNKFIFCCIFFTIAGIISLMTPLVIGLIFNSIQQEITSDAELKKLIFMIFLLLAIQVGFWIFHGIARVFEQLTGFFVHKNYTNTKINRILELPVKWHKDHHSGDTIDKVNRGRNSLSSFSQHYTCSIIYAILNIFGSLIILFFVDVKIAIFAFTISSTMLFIVMKIDKKLIEYYKKLNDYSNKLSSSIFDYLSNIITVITLRLKKIVSKEIDQKLIDPYKIHKKSVVINEIKWGFSSIIITLMTVLVLSFKAYTDYKTTGIIMIGTLYILHGYLSKVGNTFFEFASLYGQITRHDARISGAFPIDRAFERIEGKVGGKLPVEWEEIELKNFNFKYNIEGKEQHMKNVNLKFRRGQKIALIGESGSGKSTILALIRGLYSPDSGDVFVNGEKLTKGVEKIKNYVTLIPQDPEIFNNTIKNNITMGLTTKKEDLEKAISIAQLKDVIKRLEKGLNTSVLEKGVSLSGGEKQRLALARGVLAAKNSEIILLDEPTSSVDSLNEMKIHNNMFEEFKYKTIISSIHRLHLLKNFDCIYMFEKGKVIAHGTLDDLKRNSKFRHIWRKYGLIKE